MVLKREFGVEKKVNIGIWKTVSKLTKELLNSDNCRYCHYDKSYYSMMIARAALTRSSFKSSLDWAKKNISAPGQNAFYKKIRISNPTGFIPGSLDQIQKASIKYKKAYVLIDHSLYPFYKRNAPLPEWIIGGKTKHSTKWFLRIFAVSVCFEGGPHFFVYACCAQKGFDVASNMLLVLDKIRRACGANIVLADRGFYSSVIMQAIERMGFQFVIPARSSPKMREEALFLFRGDSVPYEIGQIKYGVKLARSQKGNMFMLSSNLSVRTIEKYMERWSIETGFRDINFWFENPPSANKSVKMMSFFTSAIVYNLWQFESIKKKLIVVESRLAILLEAYQNIHRDPINSGIG